MRAGAETAQKGVKPGSSKACPQLVRRQRPMRPKIKHPIAHGHSFRMAKIKLDKSVTVRIEKPGVIEQDQKNQSFAGGQVRRFGPQKWRARKIGADRERQRGIGLRFGWREPSAAKFTALRLRLAIARRKSRRIVRTLALKEPAEPFAKFRLIMPPQCL